MKRRVGIIGGGASGLAAAIEAARAGAQVTIIEHMDRVGKKILSTGNGRCNLTNLRMESDCFRSSQKSFPMKVIEGFPVEETLEFFGILGIVPKNRNGYIYPNSDQASSVLDVLRSETSHLGVEVLLSCHVKEIREGDHGGFAILTDQGRVDTDALILAAGSKAAPATGSDGSGYELAKSLGHTLIKPLPALVQLRCQGSMYKQLAGIRTDASICLTIDGKKTAEDRGELQLTDYGLSGIPVFQVSRFAARALDEGKKVRAYIDFMPEWEAKDAFYLLRKRADMVGYKPAEELFTGMLNKKLGAVLLKLAGISPEKKVGELSGKQIAKLLGQLKEYEAIVMSVNPFANAQVCCGGVDTRQVDPSTMESKIRKDLYLAGEILDVDGICGGYNLQFAWSSGVLAGRSAAGAGSSGPGERQAARVSHGSGASASRSFAARPSRTEEHKKRSIPKEKRNHR